MNQEVIDTIRNKGLVILKTDTLYGIIGSAYDPEVVERVYTLKERDASKPFIILIHDIKELHNFGIELNDEQATYCLKLWQESPTSILFYVHEYEYLHRGKKSLAFRIPQNRELQELLSHTGPVIAPSANPQAKEPASDIQKAKEYFGDAIDLYVDEGASGEVKASRVVSIAENGEVILVRS